MLKKIFIIILCLLLSFCFISCNKTIIDNNNDEENKIEEEKTMEELGYSSVFSDKNFINGFTVSSNQEGTAKPYLETPIKLYENDIKPSWVFAQWGSNYNIIDYYQKAVINSGQGLKYLSKGKLIGSEYLPAKILSFNTETSEIYMELNAETEYDEPRVEIQSWPHTLIEQSFYDDSLINLSECSNIKMVIDFNILKFEDKMNGFTNTNLHAAQFVWYVTLQNRNTSSADFGKYIWFGLCLWDNRYENLEKSLYAAEDGGKETNTGAFIYSPESNLYYNGNKMPASLTDVNVCFDIMTIAESAYNLAISRGYLGTTKFNDLYIGSTNLGFEVPGTYNVASKINNFNIFYKKTN
jgi:hypothetical protein